MEEGIYDVLKEKLVGRLSKIEPKNPLEEFGPLTLLIRVKDEDEAISVASSSCFGLDAAVFSRNDERTKKVVRKLEVGAVFINEVPRHGIGLSFRRDEGQRNRQGRHWLFH